MTNENMINGYYEHILNIIYIFLIILSILTITTKNPIFSIIFLIGLFGGVACYLIIIGLSFIGLSYLIVYIGAVSILFLFILMLINIRISELQNDTNNNIPLIIILLTVFYTLLSKLLPYGISTWNQEEKFPLKKNQDFEMIQFTTSNSWDGNIIEADHITSIGNIIYTNYNIWLIITSYILLLAMVGTITITIKKNY